MDWQPLGVTPEHGIVPKQRRAETKSNNKQQLTSNKKAQIHHDDSCNGLGAMGKKQQSTFDDQKINNQPLEDQQSNNQIFFIGRR